MKFKTVKVGGAVVVGGAVALVMVAHPITLLAKGACVLAGGFLGAMATDPLQEKIDKLTVKIAGLHVAVEVLAARGVQASWAAG